MKLKIFASIPHFDPLTNIHDNQLLLVVFLQKEFYCIKLSFFKAQYSRTMLIKCCIVGITIRKAFTQMCYFIRLCLAKYEY